MLYLIAGACTRWR